MTRLAWLVVSVLSLLNLPTSLADDHQDSRQFNFNPGNVADGMMNPMRGMFGGFDRNRGYYDDYYENPYYYGNPSYYGSPGYPGEYGYPGYGYAQPNPGYGTYPAYPDYYAAPVAPQSQPMPQEQPTARQAPNREPAPTYYEPQGAPPSYWQQPSTDAYTFRPMEAQPDLSGGYTQSPAPYAQPGTYPSGPETYPSPQSGYPNGYEAMPQDGYGSYEQSPAYPTGPVGAYSDPYGASPARTYPGQEINGYNGSLESGLKFRPLDQPGYSQ
jgi:hypothetical protein